ncbi:MAG: GSCFA domain-containing protein [Bacteroidales bacterium]|nr:GSCFA domain-containing protein [Bacteroidales bacterium]
MEFRTSVQLPASLPKLDHTQKSLIMGSCFAEHIGNRLSDNKFDIQINPFGVLYNPSSITSSLQALLDAKIFTSNDLFEQEGVWNSFSHHSRFSDLSIDNCLQKINTEASRAQKQLKACDLLTITFGSAFVYKLKSDGSVVSNCHKRSEKSFDRHRLSVDEIVVPYKELIPRLLTLHPEMKIVCTVSPIRHLKDGLHANQLSKATLLLAIDQLCCLFPETVFYFPAYEIVMDELRDYRFYADDMTHPSGVAIEYIWECFCHCCIAKKSLQFMTLWQEIQRAINHRPFQPQSAAFQTFVRKNEEKLELLSSHYPSIDFAKEKEYFRGLLSD